MCKKPFIFSYKFLLREEKLDIWKTDRTFSLNKYNRMRTEPQPDKRK